MYQIISYDIIYLFILSDMDIWVDGLWTLDFKTSPSACRTFRSISISEIGQLDDCSWLNQINIIKPKKLKLKS